MCSSIACDIFSLSSCSAVVSVCLFSFLFFSLRIQSNTTEKYRTILIPTNVSDTDCLCVRAVVYERLGVQLYACSTVHNYSWKCDRTRGERKKIRSLLIPVYWCADDVAHHATPSNMLRDAFWLVQIACVYRTRTSAQLVEIVTMNQYTHIFVLLSLYRSKWLDYISHRFTRLLYKHFSL